MHACTHFPDYYLVSFLLVGLWLPASFIPQGGTRDIGPLGSSPHSPQSSDCARLGNSFFVAQLVLRDWLANRHWVLAMFYRPDRGSFSPPKPNIPFGVESQKFVPAFRPTHHPQAHWWGWGRLHSQMHDQGGLWTRGEVLGLCLQHSRPWAHQRLQDLPGEAEVVLRLRGTVAAFPGFSVFF